MLRILLQSLLPVLQNAGAVVIPLAMVMGVVAKGSGIVTQWYWRGIRAGIVASLLATLMKLTAAIRDRELFEGWVLVLGILTEALLVCCYWLAYKRGRPEHGGHIDISSWLAFLAPIAMIVYWGLEFFLFYREVLLPQTATFVWETFLLQTGGTLLGLGLAFLAGLTAFKIALRLPAGQLGTVLTLGFGAVMAQQAVAVIQVLMARGVLPLDTWLLERMAPLINHGEWFFLALLAVTFLLPVLLFLQKKPVQPAGLNPAQYRKILAAARKQLRWAGASAVVVLALAGLMTAGKAYADQQAELVPAVPMQAEQGEIIVPLDTVSDGRLHRFSYLAADSTTVRFIIVKKGGSAYGVGLDACDICGPTGYYERDNDIVCKLCDVVMNKATIGFKGGCNPVPLEYKITGGKIIIPAQALENESKRFSR